MPEIGETRAENLRFVAEAPDVWDSLRKIERTGWVQWGVVHPETVAEHTLDLLRIAGEVGHFTKEERHDLLCMLEVHDWPEAIRGDEVVLDDGSEEYVARLKNKLQDEYSAMQIITANMGEVGERILALWLRFETGNDPVASFARQLDKYQAVEQAYKYEQTQSIPLFKEFYDYSRPFITDKLLVDKMDDLNRALYPGA